MIVVMEAPAKRIDVSTSIMINPFMLSNGILNCNNLYHQTWRHSMGALLENMIRT